MKHVSGFHFVSFGGVGLLRLGILCPGVPYKEEESLLEAQSGPKPFAQLSLLGLGTRDAERSGLAASRRHHRP